MDEAAWVTVAVVNKPRGNKGELQCVSLSDHPERWERLERAFLFRKEEPLGEFQLEQAWWHGDRLILKWQGVDSISAAETLAGAEVRIPAEERLELPEGKYYQTDLVGCELVDGKTGESLGRVTGWEELGGPVGSPGLMEIDEDWVVPFHPDICREIRLEERRIVVDLPVGLKELNRP